MTKAKVADWDITADNNVDIDGTNIAEGCPAQNLNNAVRIVMAQIKTWTLGFVSATKASAGNIWGLSSDAKIVTPESLGLATTIVALTDTGTIAIDQATGFNFKVVLGGNRKLGNLQNAKPGTSGFIIVRQDATGSRTFGFDTNYTVMGGTTPTFNTAANAVNVVFYLVESPTSILLFVTKS